MGHNTNQAVTPMQTMGSGKRRTEPRNTENMVGKPNRQEVASVRRSGETPPTQTNGNHNMKKLIPNCIIGFTTHGGKLVALFHVNSDLEVNCALNRLTNGQLENKFNGSVHCGATMFNRDPIYTGIWEHDILTRGVVVDSHCVEPTNLNSGDLRRLCKKVVRKERKQAAK